MIEMALQEFDKIIIEALGEFRDSINKNKWIGRENEAVNCFVFSHLLKRVKPNTILHDPGQIGIEVAVPQTKGPVGTGKKQKPQVRKDLVIWPESRMTCWDKDKKPTNIPIMIIEWKFKGFQKRQRNWQKEFEGDIKWLKEFSKGKDDFMGYAVLVDISKEKYTLKCVRLINGKEVTIEIN
jgi:hypothetical protein